MSNLEDEKVGINECPECCRMTADETKDGAWVCLDGCDLSEYEYCPCCDRLYLGRPGYCDDCIHDI